MTINEKPILTSKETAEFMGISKSCLYKLTSSRKIPYYRSAGGKMIYFKKDDIVAYMCAVRKGADKEWTQKLRDAIAEIMREAREEALP